MILNAPFGLRHVDSSAECVNDVGEKLQEECIVFELQQYATMVDSQMYFIIVRAVGFTSRFFSRSVLKIIRESKQNLRTKNICM